MPIQLLKADITTVEADAIVNAANSLLVPGGGVCGAIHKVGGPIIAEACQAWVDEHGPVPPGESAITVGGNLPAHWVIHAVGPMWHDGTTGEPEQLASAYTSAIKLADEKGLTTIAFPSLSTGIFGYPLEQAAPVAVKAVLDALRAARSVGVAYLVLFGDEEYAVYEQTLNDYYAE